MCGIVGYLDLRGERAAEKNTLVSMADSVVHRGPDSAGYFLDGGLGLGFRRLSIIDLEGGGQPLFSEDGSVVLICNGEIFNYRELRRGLRQKGHVFKTGCDVEVLIHLYEECGVKLLDKINGQFAFAIYDRSRKTLFLARDHFGINPLHYTVVDDLFIFGSEIKAILQHPAVSRLVDLTGLDQVISFPGLVSPKTMLKGVESLKGGHYIVIKNADIAVREYWDLDYPKEGEATYDKPESFYVDELRGLFAQSVKYRLQADVPVGFYLSGGVDSSLVAATIKQVSPDSERHSFSIGFTEKEICESKYQRLMAGYVGSAHHETVFDWSEIAGRLSSMIYHCECPVKESFNTCSLALSESAKRGGVTVILAGEGADELFAGYIGYRFDRFGIRESRREDVEAILERELRKKLWGDEDLFYEVDQYALRDTKMALYSPAVNERFDDFDCTNFEIVNREMLKGRHFIHQRSYLDFKLRLSDHLLSEHGDRMTLANSVEGRYPFLDIDLVRFATQIPPDLKLNHFTEKYIVKRIAQDLVPGEIIDREKFGFRAPGSPYLLQQKVEFVWDMLSYERIRRQGYFNPDLVERLKSQYSQQGFKLNPHTEIDLLMIVLSFGIFLDAFGLPAFN